MELLEIENKQMGKCIKRAAMNDSVEKAITRLNLKSISDVYRKFQLLESFCTGIDEAMGCYLFLSFLSNSLEKQT